jgi:hypothetical protein
LNPETIAVAGIPKSPLVSSELLHKDLAEAPSIGHQRMRRITDILNSSWNVATTISRVAKLLSLSI